MSKVIKFIEKKEISPLKEFSGVELINLLREFEKELKEPAYFEIWDNQLKQYAFSGAQFQTKKDAINQLLDYFRVDHNKTELKEIKRMLRSYDTFADLEIMKGGLS